MLLDVVDRVLDGADLLGVLVRDVDLEGLLELLPRDLLLATGAAARKALGLDATLPPQSATISKKKA